MKNLTLASLILLIGFSGFAQNQPEQKSNIKLLPVLFQQYSAEYRALCYQAFNLATLRIEKIKKKRKTHYAIITDIDETILDNSYHEAGRILEGTEFTSASWKSWTSKAAATPLPGAVEFLTLAKKKGISIFYISNRDTSEVKNTVANLKKFQLPNADAEHCLFLKDKSSKEDRRLQVLAKYNVVMLMGDNLNDFMQVFEKKNSADRNAETDKVKSEWGKKFIVLPNVTYGEWENALYDYQRNLTPEQKELKLREKLKVNP